MHRANPRLSSVSLAAMIAGGLAFSAPSLGAGADFYLKLGPVKGESTASPPGGIEIQAWSWGVSNSGSAHTGGGMGAGKVAISDSASSTYSQVKREKGGKDAASSPVAAGDVDGDGTADIGTPRDAASGLATGKRQHGPVTIIKELDKSTPVLARAAPPSSAAGSLTTLVPAGMCKAGATYPSAELGTPGRVYRLEGVTVASCDAAASSGDRPMESISLNYTKIQW